MLQVILVGGLVFHIAVGFLAITRLGQDKAKSGGLEWDHGQIYQ